MSYYVMKRLYSPLAVSVYRDLEDVRVVVSNHSGEKRETDLIIRHLSENGACIEEKRVCRISVEAGETTCKAVMPELYQRVCDRTKEIIHVVLKEGETVVSEDVLFFCPYSEYIPLAGQVFCEVMEHSEKYMVLRFKTDGIIPMVCIEGSKSVCSDNYFFLAAGYDREIWLEWMEAAEEKKIVVKDLYGNELWRESGI